MKLGLTTMTGKLVASVAVLGSAAAVAGLGTFGTFTSSTSASTSVGTGTVQIALGATGAATNRLNVNATGLVPGDSVQRSFDLNNTGSQALSLLQLTTTATTSSALNTDTTNGLQLVVDSCSTAWVETAVAGGGYTYTCSGTTGTLLASSPVVQANKTLAGLNALTAGGTDHLRVTLTLPTAADNTFQGLNSTIAFAFTGTQRAATNK